MDKLKVVAGIVLCIVIVVLAFVGLSNVHIENMHKSGFCKKQANISNPSIGMVWVNCDKP